MKEKECYELNEINVDSKIAESNKLIREMFDFTVTKRQFDLIYTIISLVKETDTRFTEYNLTYEAIGKIFNPANPKCDVTQNDIVKAIKDIMKSCFRIKTDKSEKYYHWVETAENFKDEKYITFKLNEEVQQFYLQLKSGEYTIYLLKDLLALSTIFQANIFRWLCCNAGFNNSIKISIEDAKLFSYGNSDIATKRFIEKLDNALNVINEKTKISATYKKIKQGRKIAFLEFDIHNKYITSEKPATNKSLPDKDKGKKMWQENLDLKAENEKLKRELEAVKK